MTTTITDGTDVSTITRTNRFTNPSFETNVAGVLYSSTVWSQVVSSTFMPLAGARSLGLTLSATPSALSYVGEQLDGEVTPGNFVAATFSVRPSGWQGGGRLRARFTFHDANGTQLEAGPWAGFVPMPNATYTAITTVAQVPPAAARARAYFYVSGLTTDTPPANGVLASDAWISAEAATEAEALAAVTPYFDGDTPPAPPLSYRYLGAPGASASVEVETLPHAVTPTLVLDYAYDREARTIVHAVLDRSDPDVTLRPTGLRRGTLVLFCLDRAQALDIEEMHRSPRVFTLTSDDEVGVDMSYVVTGRLAVELDAQYGKWTVRVDYAEVAT